MSFARVLLQTPGPHTPLSRYTFFSGVFYLGFGLITYAWPGILQTVLRAEPFVGHEAGMLRLSGVMLSIIGYFYVFGSRTRSESFGLATVLDRLLVPLFLVPLGITGAIEPALAYLFSVVDPVLGIGAYLIWRRTSQSFTGGN